MSQKGNGAIQGKELRPPLHLCVVAKGDNFTFTNWFVGLRIKHSLNISPSGCHVHEFFESLLIMKQAGFTLESKIY